MITSGFELRYLIQARLSALSTQPRQLWADVGVLNRVYWSVCKTIDLPVALCGRRQPAIAQHDFELD